MAKRVILHIGFHKTGSSALQVFLATNADRLAANGIGYPYADPESVVATGGCSGNAVQVLFRGGFMTGFNANIEKPADRMNEAYFDALIRVIDAVPQPTVLISGEILGLASKNDLDSFIEKICPHNDVQIVCYVRDPFDFVFSSWMQIVKEKSQASFFSDYMDRVIDGTNTPSMLKSFEFFHTSGIPLTVINFDHHRHDIAVPFLRAISAGNLAGQVKLTTTQEANRSLTPSEAHLAVLLYEKIKNKDFVATFIRAVQIRGRIKAVQYYNRDQHQRVLDRFASTISLINGHLADDQKLATEVRSGPDVDFAIVPEDAALLLELVKNLILARGAATVGPISRDGLTTPFVLPSDFDPQAYLFHNPDVAAAKVDAARHYIEHGWREGRRYRFF